MIRAQNWCHSAVSVDSYIICAHDPDWWNWRWGEGLLRAHSRHSGFWIYVHCPSGFVWSSQLQSRPSISLHGRLKEIICAIAYRVWINPMWMLVFLVPTEEKLRTPSFTLSSHTDSSLLASQVLRVTHYMALISLWWNFAKTAFGFYSREDFFSGALAITISWVFIFSQINRNVKIPYLTFAILDPRREEPCQACLTSGPFLKQLMS